MSGEFWENPVAQRLLEITLPALVKQLERVADALEALVVIHAKKAVRSR